MTVFLDAAGVKSLSASTSVSFPESRLMILAASKSSPSKESAYILRVSNIRVQVIVTILVRPCFKFICEIVIHIRSFIIIIVIFIFLPSLALAAKNGR
ncbi:hypothetical protein BDR05DRAFT_123150 [Suillus weaverae]|nr:hypothetical protein BDR05DRAFT_123150 [Suillus weaverae]